MHLGNRFSNKHGSTLTVHNGPNSEKSAIQGIAAMLEVIGQQPHIFQFLAHVNVHIKVQFTLSALLLKVYLLIANERKKKSKSFQLFAKYKLYSTKQQQDFEFEI